MTQIMATGQCYLARSSEYCSAILYFHENGGLSLHLDAQEQTVIEATLSEVNVSSSLGNTPREISFPDGSLFRFEEDIQVAQWLSERGSKSLINGLEKNTLFIASGLVLVPVIIFCIFRFAIPAFAVHFSTWVPEPVIQTSSQHTLRAFDRLLLDESTLDETTKVDFLAEWQQRIDAYIGHSDQYTILFRASEKMGANAFALPDGTIVITDELVRLMADHPDALFSIILHEIGHVEHRHSMRYIAETLATSVLVNYLFGDISGIVDLFVGMSATVASNQFSQKLEWQADNFALETLRNNNESTESFALAMELFLQEIEETSIDTLLSTHPLLKERAENARAKLRTSHAIEKQSHP